MNTTTLFENDTRKIIRHDYTGYTLILDTRAYTIVRDYTFRNGRNITETHQRGQKPPYLNKTSWKVDGEQARPNVAKALLAELLEQYREPVKQISRLVPGDTVQVAAQDIEPHWTIIVDSAPHTVICRTPSYSTDRAMLLTLVLMGEAGHSFPLQVGVNSKFLRVL